MSQLFDILFGNLALTKIERSVVDYFLERPGEVVSKEQLLEDVWGYSADTKTRTVTSTLERIRKKFDDGSGPKIQTVWGKGFAFDVSEIDESYLSEALAPIVAEDPNEWALTFFHASGPPVFGALVNFTDLETTLISIEVAVDDALLGETANSVVQSLKNREVLTEIETETLRRVSRHLVFSVEDVNIVRSHAAVSFAPEIGTEILEYAAVADVSADAYRCTCVGWFLQMSYHEEKMDHWFGRMEELIGETDPEIVSDLLRIYGWSLSAINRHAEAKTVYARAADVATTPLDEAHCKFAIGTTLLIDRDPKCVVLFAESAKIYESLDDDEMSALSIVKQAMFFIYTDDVEKAKPLLDDLAFSDLPVRLQIDFIYAQSMICLRDDPSRSDRWLSLTQPGLSPGQIEMKKFLAILAKGSSNKHDWQPFMIQPSGPWGLIRYIVAALSLSEWPTFDVSDDVEDLILQSRTMLKNEKTLVDCFFLLASQSLETFRVS